MFLPNSCSQSANAHWAIHWLTLSKLGGVGLPSASARSSAGRQKHTLKSTMKISLAYTRVWAQMKRAFPSFEDVSHPPSQAISLDYDLGGPQAAGHIGDEDRPAQER